MSFKYIILVVGIGMALAQSEPSISDALNNLPPELQGKVNEKQVNDLKNKSMQVFKKKCDENGGPNAYQASEKALSGFVDCLKELVDPSKLQDEIENAKPNGQVDEVFKKYCEKTPLFKACFRNLTEAAKPCFSLEEQKNLKTVYNISEQMADFVCFKEGDRIALFIAENGPECFNEKKLEIEDCLNKTFNSDVKFDAEKLSLDSIPEIKFGDKECKQFSDLQTCIVAALETCSAPTSANIVESLFKYARKSTPCKELPGVEESNARSQTDASAKQQSNSANSLKSFALIVSTLALFL